MSNIKSTALNQHNHDESLKNSSDAGYMRKLKRFGYYEDTGEMFDYDDQSVSVTNDDDDAPCMLFNYSKHQKKLLLDKCVTLLINCMQWWRLSNTTVMTWA